MSARDAEARLLALCERIARGEGDAVADEREANVVRLAAMLMRPRHPRAAQRLRAGADDYFSRYPRQERSAERTVREGWLVGVPRFRASLERRLRGS